MHFHLSLNLIALSILFLLVVMLWNGLRSIPSVRSFASSLSSMADKDNKLILKQAQTLLQQKLAILKILQEEDYSRKDPNVFNSSVGGHFRHSLDHYQAVVHAASSDSSLADYDNRSRDTLIEMNISAARESIEQIQRKLNDMDLTKTISVSFIGETEKFTTYTVPSTVARELSFAAHHGVHHMSMVKLILQGMKYELPEGASNVGLAASTVKFIKQA